MKFPRIYALKEIAAMIHARSIGDENFPVSGINEIHMVEPGDITFVNVEKYYQKALNSKATIIIIDKEVECPEGKVLLVSEDPFRDFTFICKYFRPTAKPHAQAQYLLGENSTIGENTWIHHGVVIGNNVKIGNNCIIYPNTVIYDHTSIGDNVIIHANTTIGGDAFYYSRFQKMHSCGDVILHDWVEIGASCTIDRGVTGSTVIGRYTKLDNQVHIGHDTQIGEKCILAAQVGIAGVTIVEDEVILWGKVGVNKEVIIRKGTIAMGQSGITKSTEAGKVYFGTPARENRKILREMAAVSKLPELLGQLK